MTPESVNTEAGEVTDAVQTGALVEAGIRKAVVRVDETVPALEAAGALALVAAVGVDAGGPIPVLKKSHFEEALPLVPFNFFAPVAKLCFYRG